MKKDEKRNRITEFSDYDFLCYLYSERDREESLNSYQGWSIWAITGAFFTVICTGYSILCKHYDDLDSLRIVYILSGILGFCISCRPYFLIYKWFLSRERGIDYKKLKYLKDITPKPYLWIALPLSIFFSVFFFVHEYPNPWNTISIGWMISSFILIVSTLYVVINKNKIVWSAIDETIFGDRALDSCFGGLLSGVMAITWLNSFNKIRGNIIADSDFDIAVCLFAAVALLYLFLTIKSREKMSSRMDVLLDDYLYKERDKEEIYHQILIHRMGYGVLEACAHELYMMQDSFKNFEPQMKAIEKVNQLLSDETIDINKLTSYFDVINSALEYTDNCSKQARLLDNKLNQIGKQVPNIKDVEEYKNLFLIVNALLQKENKVLKEVRETAEKVKTRIALYHCKKYGGLCMTKDCPYRNDRKSFSYRIKLLQIRFARKFRLIIKPRLDCNK